MDDEKKKIALDSLRFMAITYAPVLPLVLITMADETFFKLTERWVYVMPLLLFPYVTGAMCMKLKQYRGESASSLVIIATIFFLAGLIEMNILQDFEGTGAPGMMLALLVLLPTALVDLLFLLLGPAIAAGNGLIKFKLFLANAAILIIGSTATFLIGLLVFKALEPLAKANYLGGTDILAPLGIVLVLMTIFGPMLITTVMLAAGLNAIRLQKLQAENRRKE